MRALHLAMLSVVVLLAGCATPKYNYRPVAVDISEPALNAEVQRSVGEEMLKQGKYALVDVLNVEASTKPHWGVTVLPGLFRKTGADEEANYYDLGGRGGESGAVEKSWVVDPLKALMVKKSDRSICVITILNASACSDKEKDNYKEERRSVVYENSVQQTLIYSGRIGSRIRFGYREFSNNYARPAFSNDVEYDLLESRTIAYKGAMIEVIEATNQYIRYVVKRNFNQAVGPVMPHVPSDPAPTSRELKNSI